MNEAGLPEHHIFITDFSIRLGFIASPSELNLPQEFVLTGPSTVHDELAQCRWELVRAKADVTQSRDELARARSENIFYTSALMQALEKLAKTPPLSPEVLSGLPVLGEHNLITLAENGFLSRRFAGFLRVLNKIPGFWSFFRGAAKMKQALKGPHNRLSADSKQKSPTDSGNMEPPT